VLFLDDLDVWPDETGIQDIVIHFGARLDLAFGGGGKRHLDRTGPEARTEIDEGIHQLGHQRHGRLPRRCT
jgi:hypothetical protein